jgi:hypothetical protein
MGVRPTNEYDIELCQKLFNWLQWIQAILGIFLLFQTMITGVHVVLAAVAIIVLLLAHLHWEKTVSRVFARILCGIIPALAVLFLTDMVLTLVNGGTLTAISNTMCVIGGVVLSYLSLAAGTVSLKEGRYDRIIACFSYTWLLGITLLASFTNVSYSIVWSWDNHIVRIVWVAVVGVATLLCWMCALMRTPEQKAAIRAAKAEKKAAKAAKKEARANEKAGITG